MNPPLRNRLLMAWVPSNSAPPMAPPGMLFKRAAGASRVEVRGPAGNQERQREHVASLQRQVHHLLGIDGVGQDAGIGFHQRRFALHRDGLLRGADFQRRLDIGGAAGLHL